MKRPTSGSNLTDAILATAVILWPSITLGMAYDADRGTIAEWVAALATLGALLAALYAGQQAAKIVDVEQRRDADRDAAGRRAQADQVAAWGIKGKDLRPQLLQRPGLQRPGRRRVRGQVRRRPSGRSTTNPPPPPARQLRSTSQGSAASTPTQSSNSNPRAATGSTHECRSASSSTTQPASSGDATHAAPSPS